MRNFFINLAIIAGSCMVLGGCAEERPVRSVNEFMEDPIMLEAAMVRCSVDRTKTRYDAECVNARQAVAQIEAKEDARRRAEFEARSESKRQSLRRAQEAAAQARRRAAEKERLRKEAEYAAQFGVAPPPDGVAADGEQVGNTPGASIPAPLTEQSSSQGGSAIVPATDGGNAPVQTNAPQTEAADLDSIREELQRRSEEEGAD